MRWVVGAAVVGAVAALFVWGLLHRGDAGGAIAIAVAPIVLVLGIRALARLD